MAKHTKKPPPRKPGLPPLAQLSAQPPPGSPFFGISGTNAPARDTRIPNLTDKVALAKARKLRLQNAGLLTAPQREAEAKAAKRIDAPKSKSKPAARKPQSLIPLAKAKPPPSFGIGGPYGEDTQPLTPPSALAKTPALLPTTRGVTPNPKNLKPGDVGWFSSMEPKGYFGSGVDWEKTARLGSDHPWSEAFRNVAHGIDLGVGTTAQGVLGSVGIGPNILGRPAFDSKSYVTSEEAASNLTNAGLHLPKTIPSIDLVGPASAKATSYTPEELVAVGLSEAQTKRFRARALKNGWYKGEIDHLVGLDLIKRAYNKPPNKLLRIGENLGAGLIRTGALPNVGVALAQEAVSGHAGRAAKQIGDVAASQFGGIIEHPGEAAVSDPYVFVPGVGGALKTLGSVGHLINRGAAPVARDVALATTGAVVNRGVRSKNFYTASGQLISDAAAAKVPAVARRVEARSVDKLVHDVSDATAPLHHGVQTEYAKAFKSVGAKRAEILSGINKSGNKPGKILAKYKRDGNQRQVAYWTQVVAATKNLSEKDRAFLKAHRGVSEHTTATHVDLGRFSDTAGVFRQHQPLILSDARAGDPMAQRVEALHEEWVKALRTTDDEAELAPLFGAYDHAVREYAATHLATGGEAPVRVAYTPPPDTGVFTSPYRKGTGGRVRFNARVTKQKATTGKSFESGNYLVDPKVALRENLQAQRLRTSVGLTSDESLAKIGALKAQRGDQRPEGYVFTPSQNPATVGKVISDLHDQPVSAHDYYHQEASIRERLAQHLEHDADSTGEYARTDGWFVPEGSWRRILDYTRPESRAAYDQFMRQYQRAMISIFPSTMLGNTLGSMPLAIAAGAGPKSFREAARSSSFKGDPTLVPFTSHGRGVAASLAGDARNPITRQMDRNRRVNVIGEDFSADAAYFSKVLPGSAKRAKELGYKNRDEYLRDLATGKVDVELRDQALERVIKFVGDKAKPATKTTKRLGKVVLFPQWLQHMSKLMLVTLPLHHPRRLALINVLAEYGDNYRKEHGVWPAWMTEFAPIFQHTIGTNEFTRSVGLSQLAPQGTAGGVADQLTYDTSVPERLAGLLNPPVAAIVNTGIQSIKNTQTDYPVDLGRMGLNQALYAIPGASKFFPRSGMAPDSLPWSPRERTYTRYDPISHRSYRIPWSKRPGARPVGQDSPFLSGENALGTASRIFGLPLYDAPNKGSINTRANTKAKQKAKKG
jgi:hypothetical protein